MKIERGISTNTDVDTLGIFLIPALASLHSVGTCINVTERIGSVLPRRRGLA